MDALLCEVDALSAELRSAAAPGLANEAAQVCELPLCHLARRTR